MKKILAVGGLLAEAGMLVGCTAQPAVAGAEMEGVICCPRCGMDDLQKFRAVISVKADGLASLTWENENQTAENLFSSGNRDARAWKMISDFSDETIPSSNILRTGSLAF